MAWAITYNGFGSGGADGDHQWGTIQINSYTATPIVDADGVSTKSLEHRITGTALISGVTAGSLETRLTYAEEHFQVPGKALLITNGGGTPIADLDPGVPAKGGADTLGLPRVIFGWEKIMGVLTALVTFEIVWTKFRDIEGVDPPDVVNHYWSQAFDIGEDGLQMHTVVGALEVRASTSTEDATTGINRGPEPDRYRTLIYPDLPEGFRQKSARFALSEDGTKLAYQIVNQEHFRGLPKPARAGSGTFTWRRSIDGDVLGHKVFEAELEGDTSAKPSELMAELLKVAQRRIRFAGQFADIIHSIEVTEHDIFSKNRVGIRIEAKGTGGLGGGGSVSGYDMVIVGSRLFNNLMGSPTGEHSEPAERPPAYGVLQLRGLARVVYDISAGTYTEDNFPKAETRDDGDGDETEVAQVIDDTIYGQVTLPWTEGYHTAEDTQIAHATYPYLDVSSTERVHVETGMTTLTSRALGVAEFGFQMRRPRVTMQSEFIIRRLNQAPFRVLLSAPPGATLLRETHEVKPGPVDSNGNREFQAIYTREVELSDIGDANNEQYFVNQVVQIPNAGQITLRTWRPKDDILRMPYDPKVSPITYADQTLFDGNASVFFNYAIAPQPYIAPGP